MSTFKSLTKYPLGSLREIIRLSFPLMMMVLSSSTMMFADRLMLSHVSLDAMAAVTITGIVIRVFYAGFTSLALIAEVFVGQHNGAKHFLKVGEPV